MYTVDRVYQLARFQGLSLQYLENAAQELALENLLPTLILSTEVVRPCSYVESELFATSPSPPNSNI